MKERIGHAGRIIQCAGPDCAQAIGKKRRPGCEITQDVTGPASGLDWGIIQDAKADPGEIILEGMDPLAGGRIVNHQPDRTTGGELSDHASNGGRRIGYVMQHAKGLYVSELAPCCMAGIQKGHDVHFMKLGFSPGHQRPQAGASQAAVRQVDIDDADLWILPFTNDVGQDFAAAGNEDVASGRARTTALARKPPRKIG